MGIMWVRADKLGLVLPLRLWSLARYLDRSGSGVVFASKLREACTKGGIVAYGNRKAINKYIRLCFQYGFFRAYSPDKTKIYISSEARLCLRVLGLDKVRNHAVQVPVKRLLANVVALRALAHNAFFGGRVEGYSKLISRLALKDETGRDKRTQRKYE